MKNWYSKQQMYYVGTEAWYILAFQALMFLGQKQVDILHL
jgi:hypothetical protein